MDLQVGQTLEYSFKASHLIDFNIHYHEGEKAFYPISEKNLSSQSSTLRPNFAHSYCPMWTNATQLTVELTYQLKVLSQENQ